MLASTRKSPPDNAQLVAGGGDAGGGAGAAEPEDALEVAADEEAVGERAERAERQRVADPVEGLRTATVVTDPSGAEPFAIGPEAFDETLRQALAEEEEAGG